jgi:hypothetical protein
MRKTISLAIIAGTLFYLYGCGGNGLGPSMVSGSLSCVPGQSNVAQIGGQDLTAITSAVGSLAALAATGMAMAEAPGKGKVGVAAPTAVATPVGTVNFNVSTLGGATTVGCVNSVTPQITVSPGS